MSDLVFLKTIQIPIFQSASTFVDPFLFSPNPSGLILQVSTSASGNVGWIYQQWEHQFSVTGNWRRLYAGGQLYELKRISLSFKLGFKLYSRIDDIAIKVWKD